VLFSLFIKLCKLGRSEAEPQYLPIQDGTVGRNKRGVYGKKIPGTAPLHASSHCSKTGLLLLAFGLIVLVGCDSAPRPKMTETPSALPAGISSSNEELERRIEERRRSMREEAERVHGGTDPNQAPIDQAPEEEGLLEPQN